MKKIKEFKEDENMQSEVEWYKKRIVDMVNQINSEKYLKMIYGFVNRLYKE